MLDNIYNYIKKGGITFVILCFALIMNHSFGYITLLGIFVIIFFFSVTIKKHTINVQETILILYLASYNLISSVNGYEFSIYTILLNLLAPFFFFQFGEYVTKKWKSENELIVFWIIIIACYCLDVFHVGIKNIITTGQLVGSVDTRFLNIESGGATYAISATGVGLCLDLAVVGLPMMIVAKEKFHKYLFLILFLTALLITFNMLNRTALIIALACFLTLQGYRSRKNKLNLIFAFVFISLFIITLMYTGIISSDLIELYTERNEDFSTAGNRTQRWSYALEQLLYNPFGWGDGVVYHVHNMWLDIARISGIIPFVILVYFAFNSFKESFKMINKYESPLMYLILGLNVCFFASCFAEPITGGTLFMLYCMLWGFPNALAKNNFQN